MSIEFYKLKSPYIYKKMDFQYWKHGDTIIEFDENKINLFMIPITGSYFLRANYINYDSPWENIDYKESDMLIKKHVKIKNL